MQGPLSQIQGQPGYKEDKKALKSDVNLGCTSYCFNFGFHLLLFEASSYAAKAVRELPIKPPASTSEWYDRRAPPSSVLLA